jgi:hypothetical protein
VPPAFLSEKEPAPVGASPHAWNVELRFGPYRPDVDDEFADRGSAARPYQQIFGTSQHLMTELEIDRQILERAGGTWAVAVSAGYSIATGAALEADLKTPSGDQTAMRLIPLSVAIVYRAEVLRTRYRSPAVPYAKAGLDCTLWQMSDTAEPSVDGRTFGWHAAAGASLNLSFLDPEAFVEMDRESGINQAALFFEGVYYDVAGFGSSAALHVGDTTWVGGLMIEF